MSCPGDNYIVPGANPCAGGGGSGTAGVASLNALTGVLEIVPGDNSIIVTAGGGQIQLQAQLAGNVVNTVNNLIGDISITPGTNTTVTKSGQNISVNTPTLVAGTGISLVPGTGNITINNTAPAGSNITNGGASVSCSAGGAVNITSNPAGVAPVITTATGFVGITAGTNMALTAGLNQNISFLTSGTGVIDFNASGSGGNLIGVNKINGSAYIPPTVTDITGSGVATVTKTGTVYNVDVPAAGAVTAITQGGASVACSGIGDININTATVGNESIAAVAKGSINLTSTDANVTIAANTNDIALALLATGAITIQSSVLPITMNNNLSVNPAGDTLTFAQSGGVNTGKIVGISEINGSAYPPNPVTSGVSQIQIVPDIGQSPINLTGSVVFANAASVSGLSLETAGNIVAYKNTGVLKLGDLTGNITLTAGSGISIVPSGQDITIAATGTVTPAVLTIQDIAPTTGGNIILTSSDGTITIDTSTAPNTIDFKGAGKPKTVVDSVNGVQNDVSFTSPNGEFKFTAVGQEVQLTYAVAPTNQLSKFYRSETYTGNPLTTSYVTICSIDFTTTTTTQILGTGSFSMKYDAGFNDAGVISARIKLGTVNLAAPRYKQTQHLTGGTGQMIFDYMYIGGSEFDVAAGDYTAELQIDCSQMDVVAPNNATVFNCDMTIQVIS